MLTHMTGNERRHCVNTSQGYTIGTNNLRDEWKRLNEALDEMLDRFKEKFGLDVSVGDMSNRHKNAIRAAGIDVDSLGTLIRWEDYKRCAKVLAKRAARHCVEMDAALTDRVELEAKSDRLERKTNELAALIPLAKVISAREFQIHVYTAQRIPLRRTKEFSGNAVILAKVCLDFLAWFH